MRVTAGILLILMAVVNGVVGVGYFSVGGVASAVGDAVENSSETSAADKTVAAESKDTGGTLMAFGLFLLLLCALEIAAGVALFMNKAAVFVLAVAGMGLLAELYGSWTSGLGLLNLFGIAVAIFAFLGAKAVKDAATDGMLAAASPALAD